MGEAAKKSVRKIPVKIEFTEGYEQRFTAAVLKIYSDRKRKAADILKGNERAAS